MKRLRLRLRRKVMLDVYDTNGRLQEVWIAGKGASLTLPQPVHFSDAATGVRYSTVVTWRLVLR